MFKQFFAVSFTFSICSPPFAKKFFLRKLSLKIYEPKLAWHTSVINFSLLTSCREKKGKISLIPSKLSCIQQVSELLHVVRFLLSDSPFSSDNQSYITKVKMIIHWSRRKVKEWILKTTNKLWKYLTHCYRGGRAII